MKRIFKRIADILIRLADPCHGCAREYDCELYNTRNGYCGYWGMSFYKRKEEEK